MKIKCINSKKYPSLTKGKYYKLQAIASGGNVIYVTDDNKEILGFPFELFENIELKGL